MEFKTLKNIESSFRHLRLFSMLFLGACTLISVAAVWTSYRFAEAAAAEDLRTGSGQVADIGALAGYRPRTVPSKPASTCGASTSSSSPSLPTREAIEGQCPTGRLHLADRSAIAYYQNLAGEGISSTASSHSNVSQNGRRGQHPLRFRLLSLCYRDLRTAEDRP